MDDRPKLNRNNAVMNAASPKGLGRVTPSNITPNNTIGICSIPLLEAPKTLARNMIKFLVGVTMILLK